MKGEHFILVGDSALLPGPRGPSAGIRTRGNRDSTSFWRPLPAPTRWRTVNLWGECSRVLAAETVADNLGPRVQPGAGEPRGPPENRKVGSQERVIDLESSLERGKLQELPEQCVSSRKRSYFSARNFMSRNLSSGHDLRCTQRFSHQDINSFDTSQEKWSVA